MDGLSSRFEAPEIHLGDKLPEQSREWGEGGGQQIGLSKQFSSTRERESFCLSANALITQFKLLFCSPESGQTRIGGGGGGGGRVTQALLTHREDMQENRDFHVKVHLVESCIRHCP